MNDTATPSIWDEIPGTFKDAFPVAPPPTIYDRSTLQRWSECPAQAWLLAKHGTNAVGAPAVVGEEVHKVISEAMKSRQQDVDTPQDIREAIAGNADFARPDVQPEVVAVLRKAAYSLVSVFCYAGPGRERNPDDLMRYDGGKDERSGQLSAEIIPGHDKTPAVIVTGEVDLLLATASPAEVDLWDWKSGWRTWTAEDVKGEFQFQCYAWLIFQNYPECERVVVRVKNLRESSTTSPVTFDRERDAVTIGRRIEHTARIAGQYRTAAEPPPAWPMLDKCELCPVAAHCPYANTVPDAAADDGDLLRTLAVLTARGKQVEGVLTKRVRARREDIHADGISFGENKPRKPRASKCELYGSDGGED